jgi:hypothetical protein
MMTKTKKITRVALYLRVSTSEQAAPCLPEEVARHEEPKGRQCASKVRAGGL